MRVGFVLPQGNDLLPPGADTGDRVAQTGQEILEVARRVEAAGVDSLWMFDHLLMQEANSAERSGGWECWTLLSALAAATSRVELGTVVTCTGFRHPGVLAKMAHTAHELSGGRVILGLGAGWHQPEYDAFGFPFDHRFSRFSEALTIITDMLRRGNSTLAGRYYTTVDAPLLPPATLPPPPILIGTRRPKMLELTALHADAYNTAWLGLPGDRFREDRAALVAACEAVGRDPNSVRLTVGVDPASAGVATDSSAFADCLHAWEIEGADDVLIALEPPSDSAIDTMLEAIRQWRS